MRRLMMIGVTLGTLLLASCGGDSGGEDDRPDGGGRAPGAAVRLLDLGDDLPFDKPVTLQVDHGNVESAKVKPEDGEPLAGTVKDGKWVSDSPPEPGLSYKVIVMAADPYGGAHQLNGSFGVAGVPDSNRLTLTMQPGKGDVVGVGAPVVIRFDQEVTNQDSVEKNMHVASSPQVVGSWHWINSREVHFRPKDYWPSGTSVAVDLDLNGVRAGEELWGGRSYHLDFKVGQSRIAKVDAASHTMSIVVDGTTQATWETSLGAPEFATRNGTYIVLSKERKKRMTSCSVEITCDKNHPDFYDLEVDWSVRLTWSGTFVHAAPWSEGSQGNANVSHGCLNLSEANGEAFFKSARYGDVVTVSKSTRNASDLVERGDPGMADWNLDWDDYVDGSALDTELKTTKL